MDRFGKNNIDSFIKSSEETFKDIERSISTATLSTEDLVTDNPFNGNQCPAY